MAAGLSVDHDVVAWMQDRLQTASPDLLRDMIKTFAEALMAAEAEALCNAGYRQRTSERTNSGNGYRPRDWDTRAGTIELAVPKAALGVVLSRLAARAPPPGRGGADQRRRDQLPAGGVDPADGQAGRHPRYHQPVQEPGVQDGQGPRRAGGGVPQPAAGRRPLHLRLG